MQAASSVFLLLTCSVLLVTPKNFTPIVLWHGMGDACCFPYSLGAIQKHLNDSLPGVHMLSLKIGNSVIDDFENSYFMHPNKQVTMACEMIQADPLLRKGYNAVGFSQGSQFMRALAQRCPVPKMRTMVSVGGQHQGVYGLPNCLSVDHQTCDYLRRILNHAAYYRWLQHSLVQATYWHDPLNEDLYKQGSTFLADINNERAINQSYIDNLRALKNFVMIKFEGDTIVQPMETEWFGFYKPGQAKEIQTLQESELYKQDRLGLMKMERDGKLHFMSLPGNHLQFEWSWFEKNVIDVYFK
ncbi:hypothetical protein PPYR_10495 [Photinus pyralis]|uniref:Palmitoyl-protein thioesterase 1 n=1 Tax=Photinus pyralis TaxID=7054 RepID=A0A1Y1MLU8_PHOPY|nr:palmitoyl-protein thioesterase 1-like [Photinus pyralis]KAB0796434.1 hypothetical protein PPYR_10495 [Photinus pyralis]